MVDKIKIIVVDDRSSIVDSIAQYLDFHGFKTIKAVGSEIALELIKKEKPDLMLVDVKMPKMNGFELCDKLSNQKVLFMTGYDEFDEKAKKYKNSIGVIRKPIELPKLMNIIKKEFNIS